MRKGAAARRCPEEVPADEQELDLRGKRRTSGQRTAKSISIKGAKRKSGGRAQKAVGLISGRLGHVPRGLREPKGSLTPLQESAEGVVRPAQSALHQDESLKDVSRRRSFVNIGAT